MRRTYSLRTLALAAALAMLLLPLLALGGGLAGTMVANMSAITMASEEVAAVEEAVARLVTERWDELDGDRFAGELDRLHERWNFAVEVRGLDDRVRYASPTVADGELALSGFTVQPSQRTRMLQRDGRPLGVLLLWVWPTAALSGLSAAAKVGLGAGFGTLLVLLLGVLWWIGRAMLRPLKELEAATAAVAEGGDLNFRPPRSQVRELDALGLSFATMQERLRAALERQAALQEERRQLIAAIGHDLRTPLASVRAFAEGLRDGIAREPEKAAHYGEVILRKTAEVERLVEDLFQFARLELPETRVARQEVDLAEFLTAALGAFGAQADEKGVALRAEGPPLSARLDPDLMGRAVGNLLANALRHTPSGGEIRLSWRSTADALEIAVADTGEGIPPEQLPHLFTPMHRTDTSRSRRSGGAGLGLAIVARIAALHGGRVTCESRVGEGSTFTITLPMAGPQEN
ncbi:signal transduction histidine kinase [Symbiobacterium terraclitae]|uniref:histidine kinase n=1 Tax=Symbiobacterium terraclitae TaxID=557451 RepID=A0ABS4JPJ6_9FIRM|nr:HAMP domain-containing sensor histidine kinase [Symbiobacterium terraclitae]MBP2017440.1 signal transduction histidine kinase [Symbiobacterium terraclitae]